MLTDKIEKARLEAGVKLKPLADKAGVNYATLYNQITHNRPIPFETVDALADALGLPLEYFSSRPRQIDQSISIANRVLSAARALVAADDARASGPTAQDFWRRLYEVDFELDEIGAIGAHIDIYEPLDPSHDAPRPVAFGRKSLIRSELGICTPSDYYERMTQFDDGIKERSLQCHANALQHRFQTGTEVIFEQIDGQMVAGCYIRSVAQGRVRTGELRTAILTEYVTRLPAEPTTPIDAA